MCTTLSFAQNESNSTSNGNVIVVDASASRSFGIQIAATKQPLKSTGIISSFDEVLQFNCLDGYIRYVVGQFDSKEEATKQLETIRNTHPSFKGAYVVNTANYKLKTSANLIDKTAISSVRTNKKIIPTDKATSPYFAIQILALRQAPQDPKFFQNVEFAREFTCTDGFKRYVVGQYLTKEEAQAELAAIRALSPKYKDAFVVNTENFAIEAAEFTKSFADETGTNTSRTSKRIIPTDKATDPYFAIQVIALKDAPKDASFFDKLDVAREFSCKDGLKRYVVGQYATEEEARADLEGIRALGPKYKNSFVVNTAKFNLELSAFTKDYSATAPKNNTDEKAENPSTRTSKKIIPVDKATQPYFTVQLLALTEAPNDPDFFNNIENAREFSCKDGYKRYVVGQYNTAEEAAAEVKRIRQLDEKYKGAFVANTANFDIAKSDFQSDFSKSEPVTTAQTKASTLKANTKTPTVAEPKIIAQPIEEPAETGTTDENVVKDKPIDIVIDPNKLYTIQLTASRYPFYISEIKEFTEVYEFYMPDKVYRYCEGKHKGTVVKAELKKALDLGYKDAFIVEWEKYAAYQIE